MNHKFLICILAKLRIRLYYLKDKRNLPALVLRHFRCIGTIEKLALHNTRNLLISIVIDVHSYWTKGYATFRSCGRYNWRS